MAEYRSGYCFDARNDHREHGIPVEVFAAHGLIRGKPEQSR